MSLNKWGEGEAWQRSVRGYEQSVVHQLALALSWRDVLQARGECERQLKDATKRQKDAEKRHAKATETANDAQREVERVHKRYLDAIARGTRDADKQLRPDDLPESVALGEAGQKLRRAERERRDASTELAKATRDLEGLQDIERRLSVLREPDVELVREIGLWKA